MKTSVLSELSIKSLFLFLVIGQQTATARPNQPTLDLMPNRGILIRTTSGHNNGVITKEHRIVTGLRYENKRLGNAVNLLELIYLPDGTKRKHKVHIVSSDVAFVGGLERQNVKCEWRPIGWAPLQQDEMQISAEYTIIDCLYKKHVYKKQYFPTRWSLWIKTDSLDYGNHYSREKDYIFKGKDKSG